MIGVRGVLFASISPNPLCFLNLCETTIVKGERDRAVANRPHRANEFTQKLGLPCRCGFAKVLKVRSNSTAAASRLSPASMSFRGMANVREGSVIENVGGCVPHRKENTE